MCHYTVPYSQAGFRGTPGNLGMYVQIDRLTVIKIFEEKATTRDMYGQYILKGKHIHVLFAPNHFGMKE